MFAFYQKWEGNSFLIPRAFSKFQLLHLNTHLSQSFFWVMETSVSEQLVGRALGEDTGPVQAASLVNIKLYVWCETIATEDCETLCLEKKKDG